MHDKKEVDGLLTFQGCIISSSTCADPKSRGSSLIRLSSPQLYTTLHYTEGPKLEPSQVTSKAYLSQTKEFQLVGPFFAQHVRQAIIMEMPLTEYKQEGETHPLRRGGVI